jgi:F-type H+-transporting ATPase subunit delta
MENVVVARRYAKALMFSISKIYILEDIEKQFVDFVNIVNNKRSNLKKLLNNPIFSIEEKRNIIFLIFKKYGLNINLRNFFFLLIQNGRLVILESIMGLFLKELNKKLNKSKAIIVSANKINKKELDLITKSLSKHLKKTVFSEISLNKESIGGIKILVDDLFIDKTIYSNLRSLNLLLEESSI